MSAFSKLLTGFSSLMLLGAIAAVPACDSNDDDNGGEGGAGGEAGSDGKGGSAGSSAGKGGASGASGSAGKGGSGGTGSGGEAGDVGTAGASDQGGAGGEPATAGGAAGSSAGEGGSGGAGEPVIATAKFCNNVTRGDDDVEFTIRIGTGDDLVTLTALSGACAPIDACPEVLTGEAVSLEILDETGETYTEGTVEIVAGEQLVFVAEYDDTADEDERQTVEVLVLDDAGTCPDFQFSDL